MNNWRNHPCLKKRFLQDYPDDLQAIIHEGGPRLSKKKPELVWVRIVDLIDANILIAILLNKPHRLKSLKQNSILKFIIPENDIHPLMITDKYYTERPDWKIHPCNKCGLSELFDAPSDLVRKVFPKKIEDAVMCSFTSFCPLCGGAQVIENIRRDPGMLVDIDDII